MTKHTIEKKRNCSRLETKINHHSHCSNELNHSNIRFSNLCIQLEIMMELCDILHDSHIWMGLKGYWNKAFNCFCIAANSSSTHSPFKCFFPSHNIKTSHNGRLMHTRKWSWIHTFCVRILHNEMRMKRQMWCVDLC